MKVRPTLADWTVFILAVGVRRARMHPPAPRHRELLRPLLRRPNWTLCSTRKRTSPQQQASDEDACSS